MISLANGKSEFVLSRPVKARPFEKWYGTSPLDRVPGPLQKRPPRVSEFSTLKVATGPCACLVDVDPLKLFYFCHFCFVNFFSCPSSISIKVTSYPLNICNTNSGDIRVPTHDEGSGHGWLQVCYFSSGGPLSLQRRLCVPDVDGRRVVRTLRTDEYRQSLLCLAYPINGLGMLSFLAPYTSTPLPSK